MFSAWFVGGGGLPPLWCLSTLKFVLYYPPPENIVKISQKYIADPPLVSPQIEYWSCYHHRHCRHHRRRCRSPRLSRLYDVVFAIVAVVNFIVVVVVIIIFAGRVQQTPYHLRHFSMFIRPFFYIWLLVLFQLVTLPLDDSGATIRIVFTVPLSATLLITVAITATKTIAVSQWDLKLFPNNSNNFNARIFFKTKNPFMNLQ